MGSTHMSLVTFNVIALNRTRFPTQVYIAWVDGCKNSERHLITSFHYHESNPGNLHAAAHVDRGLFTIVTNPNDMQVRVNGEWVDLGPQPRGTRAVLCGYTLERVTGGVFRAALHRVRNNGERRSRTFKVRLEPSLVVRPGSITASVSPELMDCLPDEEDNSVMAVQELMDQFDQVYSSVNAPSVHAASEEGTQLPALDGSVGALSKLPSTLVYQILDWLRNLRDLSRLAQTCRLLKNVAGNEALCIPAAEADHVDWGAALDRIDRKAPSHVRVSDDNAPAMSAQNVLASPSRRWISLLGTEMTGKEMRESEFIRIRFRDQTGEETYMKLKFNTNLTRAFVTYARHKGVSIETLRFLLDGDRIEEGSTCASLEVFIDDQIDCLLEQRGD